jgi:MFS transporter, DHA1 family, multidrug resistance protein
LSLLNTDTSTRAVATLPYIGLIIGVLLGCGIVVFFEPRYIYDNRKLKENHNIPVPEQRLPPMMVGSVLFPIGMFWFAWSGNYPRRALDRSHALGGFLTGAGLMTIFLQALNYLVDAYLIVAASAIACEYIPTIILRCRIPLSRTLLDLAAKIFRFHLLTFA